MIHYLFYMLGHPGQVRQIGPTWWRIYRTHDHHVDPGHLIPCHNEVYHHHRRARALRRSHKERMMGYMSARCCMEPGSYQRQKNRNFILWGHTLVHSNGSFSCACTCVGDPKFLHTSTSKYMNVPIVEKKHTPFAPKGMSRICQYLKISRL
jgi:hypothetical protein